MNRYSLSIPKKDFSDFFKIEPEVNYKARYNIAPTQECLVIDQNGSLVSDFFWGNTPEWANGKTLSQKQIGIDIQKADSILKRSKKCIIPADGFYLWKLIGKNEKIPFRFTQKTYEPFALAAIQESYENNSENMITIFRILFDTNHPENEYYKSSFPLIITLDKLEDWLNSDASSIQKFAEVSRSLQYESYSVTPQIENAQLDNPQLIHHIPPANQKGNYTLFD
ncbi:MAG: SOS response-associated peptidase family protein [Bacteroidota bacterium]